MGYDCSVKKGKQGCNYCLNGKLIEIDDCKISIDSDDVTLDIEPNYSYEYYYLGINFCPLCGKQLRKELL